MPSGSIELFVLFEMGAHTLSNGILLLNNNGMILNNAQILSNFDPFIVMTLTSVLLASICIFYFVTISICVKLINFKEVFLMILWLD